MGTSLTLRALRALPRSTLSLSTALALLPGCRSLIDAHGGSECAADPDCPADERCDPLAGRCRAAGLPDLGPFDRPSLDASPPPMDRVVPPDVPDRDVPWADRPVMTDMADLVPPDVLQVPPDVPSVVDVPDALLLPDLPALPVSGPYAPRGNCFAGVAWGEVADSVSEGAHIPRAACDNAALVWSRVTRRDNAEWWTLNALGVHGQLELVARVAETPWQLAGDRLLVVLPNVISGDVPNLYAFDLAELEPQPDPVRPGGRAQSQPARYGTLTAFIEAGPVAGTSSVILKPDGLDDMFCGVADKRQWGVAVGADHVAFFEAPAVGGPTDIVVTRGLSCEPRLAVAASGEIEDTAQILSDGPDLLWLGFDAAARRRHVYLLRVDDPGAGPELFAPLAHLNPVEIAAADRRLLVSSFAAAGYNLTVYDRHLGRSVRVGHAGDSARLPAISGTYALWADQTNGLPWRVTYEKLQERQASDGE